MVVIVLGFYVKQAKAIFKKPNFYLYILPNILHKYIMPRRMVLYIIILYPSTPKYISMKGIFSYRK